jgi:hypothetical protein
VETGEAHAFPATGLDLALKLGQFGKIIFQPVC